MATRLDTRQRNNLRVGNALAAEIAPTVDGRRAFVLITPYHYEPDAEKKIGLYRPSRRFSKVLNSGRDFDDDVRFSYSVFEVEEAALQVYLEQRAIYDSSHLDILRRSEKGGLTSVEEVEADLSQYLDDFSRLDVEWRVIPW